MDVKHPIGELLSIPIKFIRLLQFCIGHHQCAWDASWGWWWRWVLTGHCLLLHCMKCRMPALDHLVYQVLYPLRCCQRQGRHLVIQVLVTDLAKRRHTDRHFEQQKTNKLPKPVESFLQAVTMAKVLALLNVQSFRTSNRNQECLSS